MLSLPFGMKSPYGSGVGWARLPLVVGAAPFSPYRGFEPLSEASLHALSYRCVS